MTSSNPYAPGSEAWLLYAALIVAGGVILWVVRMWLASQQRERDLRDQAAARERQAAEREREFNTQLMQIASQQTAAAQKQALATQAVGMELTRLGARPPVIGK